MCRFWKQYCTAIVRYVIHKPIHSLPSTTNENRGLLFKIEIFSQSNSYRYLRWRSNLHLSTADYTLRLVVRNTMYDAYNKTERSDTKYNVRTVIKSQNIIATCVMLWPKFKRINNNTIVLTSFEQYVYVQVLSINQ